MSGKVYCICRTSETKDRFMIACDKCEDWFHGDCVQVTIHTAKNIKKFFCPQCQSGDPTLEIERVHKKRTVSDKKKRDVADEGTPGCGKRGRPLGTTTRIRCGQCIGCFRTEDCGRCESCQQMKRVTQVGSPALAPLCRLRQCVNASLIGEMTAKRSSWKKTTPQRAKVKNVSRKGVSGAVSGRKGVGLSGTRRNTRAYQEFMKEAGLVSSEEEEDDDARQCMGIQCTRVARRNSKYCSEECGLHMAKVRLCEILPGRLSEWRRKPSAADQHQKRQLKEICERREKARQRLAELDGAEQKLEAWIRKVKGIEVDPECNSVEESEGEEANNIFCTTCGMEISAKTAMKHIVRCYSKYESQASYGSAFRTNNNLYNLFCDTYNKSNGTYCKRLRIICPEHSKDTKVGDTEICGFPIISGQNVADIPDFSASGEFQKEMACLVPKKKCSKHYQWEKLRKALIDTDRLAQLFKLDELFEEERGLRYAMASRGGVLALLLHNTTEEASGTDS